jgi:hypothetical protein
MDIHFTLEDGTKITTNSKKLYRIGLLMECEWIATAFAGTKFNKENHKTLKNVETFYYLTPDEIKKHIKKYDGVLVYAVEME